MKAERSNWQLVILLIALALTIPFLWQMGRTLLGHPTQMSEWWQLILASLIQFVCGLGLYQQAIRLWQRGAKTVDALLMLMLTLVFIYNALIVINDWPLFTYFEVNALGIVQLLFAEWLTNHIRHKGPFPSYQFSEIILQVLADKVFLAYVTGIAVLSLLAFFGWWLFAKSVSQGFIRALETWVIACPTSLALAIPTALIVGGHVVQRIGSIFQPELSKALHHKIKQNIFFTLLFPLIGVPFALAGWLNPLLVDATLAMSFFTVMTNALLLYFWLPKGPSGD